MKYFPMLFALSLNCCFAFFSCRPEDPPPPDYRLIRVNYCIEDGLWAYGDDVFEFNASDKTVFDKSTGTLVMDTPYALDSTFCQLIGSNCANTSLKDAQWRIEHPAAYWRLIIRLPASVVICLNDKVLWDDNVWSFDFQLRVMPP